MALFQYPFLVSQDHKYLHTIVEYQIQYHLQLAFLEWERVAAFEIIGYPHTFCPPTHKPPKTNTTSMVEIFSVIQTEKGLWLTVVYATNGIASMQIHTFQTSSLNVLKFFVVDSLFLLFFHYLFIFYHTMMLNFCYFTSTADLKFIGHLPQY